MFDVERVREDFPILSSEVHGRPLVYFDNSATSQKPRCVIEAVTDLYTNHNSNIHRGVHELSGRCSAAYEDARSKVRGFINAPRDEEVIFTRGTTESINLVAQSFASAYLERGDEVIVTDMEHHSNIVPWQMACERSGASLRSMPFDDDGNLETHLLEEMLNPRTRMVAVSHVSNVLGTVNPVKDIASLAHEHDVPLLVDAAQSAPHMKVDVQDIDCDFLAFSGHKVHAETGIGVLYGKSEWLEDMPPYQGGGGMVGIVKMGGTTYAEPPLKFEAGTPNYVGAVSLSAALDYIASLGMENVAKHEAVLTEHMLESLAGFEGLTLYGNAPLRCPVFSFNLDGIHHYDAGQILDKMGIAVRTGTHCAEPLMDHYGITGNVRASLAMYNTVEEIDILAEGLRKVQGLFA